MYHKLGVLPDLKWMDKVRSAHEGFDADTAELDDTSEMGPAWNSVIGGRKVKKIFNSDFGLGDMSVSLIAFDDGTFEVEVGVGEAMRPYNCLYEGNDPEKAADVYINFVRENDRG